MAMSSIILLLKWKSLVNLESRLIKIMGHLLAVVLLDDSSGGSLDGFGSNSTHFGMFF